MVIILRYIIAGSYSAPEVHYIKPYLGAQVRVNIFIYVDVYIYLYFCLLYERVYM